MVVGDLWKVRYPIYPSSEKPVFHMQTRGVGVRFKMLPRGHEVCISTKNSRDNCPDEHHFTPPPAFTWRKLTPAKRVTRIGWQGNPPRWGTLLYMWTRSRNKERLVTPPRRGTSRSRGPPTPCEQALSWKKHHVNKQPLVEHVYRNKVFILRYITFWQET